MTRFNTKFADIILIPDISTSSINVTAHIYYGAAFDYLGYSQDRNSTPKYI